MSRYAALLRPFRLHVGFTFTLGLEHETRRRYDSEEEIRILRVKEKEDIIKLYSKCELSKLGLGQNSHNLDGWLLSPMFSE